MFYLLLILFVYSLLNHRVYHIHRSEGNHRWAADKQYHELNTNNYKTLNNDWHARGRERFFGFFGMGKVVYTNSYRVKGSFTYISIMIKIPAGKEVGIDIGLVDGYDGYRTGSKYKNKLIAVVPKIKWEDPAKKDMFISYSQFGSASINTTGWLNKKPLFPKIGK